MIDKPKAIRTAAKAIIIQDNHLLVIAKRDSLGLWYILPGGGQQHGETLEQALVRECLEEIGTKVEIGKLLFVREFIGNNHLDNCVPEDDWVKNHHGLDLMFLCQIPPDYSIQNGTLPDEGQEGVEWLPLVNLDKYRLFPSILKSLLNRPSNEVYLGDVN